MTGGGAVRQRGRPNRENTLYLVRSHLVPALVAVMVLAAGSALAQDIRFFRIGTGPTGQTHFPIGGLIANAISNPPGSRECEKGGSCGVPGLIAVAQSTNGAIANVEAIGAKRLDAALAQADIAYWAYHGTGIYQGKGAIPNLRGIAMLYTDSFHLVVRKDAGIKSVKDLRGKRVSLGEQGSATLVHSKIILQTWGLRDGDVKAQYMRSGTAADAMALGKLDAFFLIDGSPVPTVAELARNTAIDLVPIDGPEAAKIRKGFPFVLTGEIPADTYQGVAHPTPTLDVGVVLLLGAEAPEDLVYGITRALWHPSTQKLLADNMRGKLMKLEAATDRMGIQLHAGAAAYYFDAGLVK